MNRFSVTSRLCVSMLFGLLAGCSGSDNSSTSTTGKHSNTVAVTTMMPGEQTFHDNLEAIGSVIDDPHRARTLSLAYGGQIIDMKITGGEQVHRGQPLLVIGPDPATRSAYQQAQAGLSLASGDLKRTRKLAAQQLATQSQVAAARKAQADAQATLQAQKAIGGGAMHVSIDAPADGVVTAVRVSLGNRLAAHTPLLDFTPAHALVAQLGVQPESDEVLRDGMKVQLKSIYGPEEGFSGTLRMVGQSIDPQTHLLPAQVELPATASKMLVAGAAITAQIHADDFTAWAVPRAAVLDDEHGDYLFQVEHGKAKRIDVKLRSPNGDTIGVQGPLDASAPVIVLGVYELNDGDAVKVAATMDHGAPATGSAGLSPTSAKSTQGSSP